MIENLLIQFFFSSAFSIILAYQFRSFDEVYAFLCQSKIKFVKEEEKKTLFMPWKLMQNEKETRGCMHLSKYGIQYTQAHRLWRYMKQHELSLSMCFSRMYTVGTHDYIIL